MDEENKKPEAKSEEAKPEEPAKSIDEGDKYETTPIIERAREERERMETVVKELREENTRRELIMAKQALGGRSEAGGEPVKPKKLTDEEYADEVAKGKADPFKDDGLDF